VTGVGFHPSIPVARRLRVLEFIMCDAGMVFFHNGSAAISMLEIALGQVDGYIGLGESSWDVMGVLPILECLGARTNLDWSRTPLSASLEIACGTPEFLRVVQPLMREA
jgi:myo-inositol-1(or 4)-monophosphatase